MHDRVLGAHTIGLGTRMSGHTSDGVARATELPARDRHTTEAIGTLSQQRLLYRDRLVQ